MSNGHVAHQLVQGWWTQIDVAQYKRDINGYNQLYNNEWKNGLGQMYKNI